MTEEIGDKEEIKFSMESSHSLSDDSLVDKMNFVDASMSHKFFTSEMLRKQRTKQMIENQEMMELGQLKKIKTLYKFDGIVGLTNCESHVISLLQCILSFPQF